jgi:2-methylaconitate cis-trans-isomerase PrpF
MPKFAIIAEPAGDQGGVAARYFTPLACHEAMAVTGGICIATACVLPGTVAQGIAKSPARTAKPWCWNTRQAAWKR